MRSAPTPEPHPEPHPGATAPRPVLVYDGDCGICTRFARLSTRLRRREGDYAVAPWQDLDLAVSRPVEDSVYPHVGDPRVDALHYRLDLTWDPEARELTGEATITFRATRRARAFQLDLGAPLDVTGATLDGETVRTVHRGKDLVVRAPVVADQRYELVVAYDGSPRPTPAPTTRQDFSSTGFTVTETGEVWTMQEPFGAFTWYPVNDQPADKALYDVTVRIVTYEQDREIAWTIEGQLNIGHVYGYRLEPIEGGTLVTQYYDWSTIEQQWRDAGIFPIISEASLRATLGILARTVAPGKARPGA